MGGMGRESDRRSGGLMCERAGRSQRCYNEIVITDTDKQTIRRIAEKYGVTRVVLFGSSLLSGGESRDIDIGVEGVKEEDFFAFYGDLLCALSKPVDVIDLSVNDRFAAMVRQEGIPLYA